MKNDIQLQTDVRAELGWDPSVDDNDVRIGAADGVLTLAGTVLSYAVKWAAERASE